MSEASTELERYAPTPPPSDSEIAVYFRMADAFAKSGAFSVRNAEQAFAKMMVGRDYGLSPAESLQLYLMDGKAEVPYFLMGRFIRQTPGHDYTVQWVKRGEDEKTLVPCDDADPDLFGVRITLLVNGAVRGISTWTDADSNRAGLKAKRGSAESNHVKYPRAMYPARAISAGVKLHVPEVMRGLPFYSEGELQQVPNLADGDGDGSEPPWTISPALQVKVEKVIKRAQKIGHVGLANASNAKQELNGQTDAVIEQWLQRSRAELDEMQKTVPEPEVVDGGPVGEVVSSDPQPTRWEKESAWKRLGELYTIRDELEALGDYTGDAGVKHQATVGEIDQLEDEFGEPGAEDPE